MSQTQTLPGSRDVVVPARAPVALRRPVWHVWAPHLMWAGALVGIALIGRSYALAATAKGDLSHYTFFWVGVLAFMLPAAAYLVARHTTRAARYATLVAVALYLDVPKYLRNPLNPLYHDEFAHWRQTQDIVRTGHLYGSNPIIAILEGFPGVHSLVASLQESGGLSTWRTGLVVLAVAHVLTLLGVAYLAERLGASARVATLAALVYALNSSYMYFDTQFAYESLAIAFFIWVLAAVVSVQTAQTRAERGSWFAVGVVMGAALIVTHHLTSTVLVALLLALALVTTVRHLVRRESREVVVWTWAFTLVFAGGVGFWLLVVAPRTVQYLSPYAGGSLHQLLNIARHHQQSRQLFTKSTTPPYERVFAFASPVVMLAGAFAGLLYARRRRLLSSAMTTLVGFAALYFASVPFILAPKGAEGARRTWAFTYVAVAVLVAPVVVARLERSLTRGRLNRLTVPALAGGFAAILIGNVGAGLNEDYRFPGPFLFGSDTRSQTPEVRALAAWFLGNEGPAKRVVTDRYTGFMLASFGRSDTAAPSRTFATYQLYFRTGLPDPVVLRQLRDYDFEFLVIDKRVARLLPYAGVYFEPDEPAAFQRSSPISPAAIDKYNWLPFTTKVFESDDYAVYRFDFRLAHTQTPALPSLAGVAK